MKISKNSKLWKILTLILTIAILFEVILFIKSDTNHSVFKLENGKFFYSLIYTKADKFWAHGCNAVKRLDLLSDEYAGVEIDAIFYGDQPKGKKFDISHDPHENLEYPLEDFMPIIAKHKDTKVWFDFKNLNRDNAKDSIEELEYLLEKYDVDKSRFIIESHYYEDLDIYHQHGFYTSFYVTINNKWFFESEEGANYFYNEVREAANSGKVDAISFPVRYYDLVKQSGVSKDLLTWNERGEKWWHFYKKDHFKKIVDDEQVKVILVEHPTIYDRY